MFINYTVLEPATKMNKMEEFMRISQQAADLIPHAAGFYNVNRITDISINAIDKCSRANITDGDCRAQDTGKIIQLNLLHF